MLAESEAWQCQSYNTLSPLPLIPLSMTQATKESQVRQEGGKEGVKDTVPTSSMQVSNLGCTWAGNRAQLWNGNENQVSN